MGTGHEGSAVFRLTSCAVLSSGGQTHAVLSSACFDSQEGYVSMWGLDMEAQRSVGSQVAKDGDRLMQFYHLCVLIHKRAVCLRGDWT